MAEANHGHNRLGTLLIFAGVGVIVIGFSLGASSCTGATLQTFASPDAFEVTDCGNQPVILCDAGASAPSCTVPEDSGSDFLATLPKGTTLRVGCIVQFPNPKPLIRTNECVLQEQCECKAVPLSGPAPGIVCGR